MLCREGNQINVSMTLPDHAFGPKGFAAGDQNLYRYVGNSPTNATDPSGMVGVSPEQAPAPRRAEKIVIVDHTGQVINPNGGLRVAKWEAAFDFRRTGSGELNLFETISNPFLKPTDKTTGYDFIDSDRDRFYVKVFDPMNWNAKLPRVDATLQTINSKGLELYNSLPTIIPLVRQESESGWYISDSQLLVSNTIDDNCEPDTTGRRVKLVDPPNREATYKKTGLLFPRSDRTHLVALGGVVNLSYVAGDSRLGTLRNSAEVPIWRVARLRVTIVKVVNEKGDLELPHDKKDVEGDIARAQELLAQLGIRLVMDGDIRVMDPPKGLRSPDKGIWLGESDAKQSLDVVSRDGEILFANSPQSTDTINIYYVKQILGNTAKGKAYTNSALKEEFAQYGRNILIGDLRENAGTFAKPREIRKRIILAHEILHVLEDRYPYNPQGATIDHFPYGDGRLRAWIPINLMAPGFEGSERGSVEDAVRLTEKQEQWLRGRQSELLIVPKER